MDVEELVPVVDPEEAVPEADVPEADESVLSDDVELLSVEAAVSDAEFVVLAESWLKIEEMSSSVGADSESPAACLFALISSIISLYVSDGSAELVLLPTLET